MEQAGSYVDAHRLRFDFSHFSAMTPEELAKVEQIVNDEINAHLPVRTSVMTLEEGRKQARWRCLAKYGDSVRVVQMGDFSTELCGGTHAANTGDIAVFKILSESGVAAGVRRIEALTGPGVFAYYKELEDRLSGGREDCEGNSCQSCGEAYAPLWLR